MNHNISIEKYLQLKYAVGMPEKISIRGRMESLGNDDVSFVNARKYEMVRMTKNRKYPKGSLRLIS